VTSRLPPGGDGRSKVPPLRTRSPAQTRTPRQLPLFTARPAAAKKTQPPAPPPRPSRLPLYAFGAVALLGLGVTVGALMIHVLTGGRQTDFSEDILAKELVPVEIAGTEGGEGGMPAEDEGLDLPDISRPAMMDLPGNPIVVRRQQNVPRQVVKIEGEAAKAATALKIPGEVFRLTDTLGSPAGGLAAGVPGSQMGFAFTQAEGEATDGEEAAAPVADSEDATVVTVNGDDDPAAGSNRVILIKPVEAETTVAALLVAGGFDAEKSKEAEAAVKRRLNVEKLTPEFGIAAVGYRSDTGTPGYVPAQIALYRGRSFIGSLAITDLGTYEDGENPWQGQEIFQEETSGAPVAKLRLLDVIYSAAVRNQLSTTVAGEIILLLSRSHDLEQPANGDESFLVLYASKARDKKSGLGRVLYVRVDRGADDSMECFAFQPAPRSPFECVSGAGEGAISGGMVTPVRGVIATKFGPGRDPVTKKRRMSRGVEWIAPPGTPVVAAYGGRVVFAGTDDKLGLTVRLAHDGGQETVYGKLKTIADGMTEGRSIRPGQRLGTVGIVAGSADSRLYFELDRNGEAADPFGEYQTRVEKGGAVEALVYRITTIESGNNCNARNPLSTAVGLGQFIESTWLRIMADYHPEMIAGKTRAQILALRTDCQIALEMTTALTRENANYIRARGQPVTPGNLYLAHFLGPGGAVQALAASPGDSVLSAFGAGVVSANPFLDGKTNGWLIEWAARKMAGKGKAPIIAASTAEAKAQSFAKNPAFVKFKDAVSRMLN